MSNKQLLTKDRDEVMWKAKNGLALTLKELAIASGYGYSQWRLWKAQGLPLIAGKTSLKKATDWLDSKMAQAQPEAALASSPKITGLLKSLLKREPFPVRSIFFDKTPEANWLVPWHQDLSIAVKERVDLPGYGPWSNKDGVPHVQPPVEILETMVTIRLHLDDCNESNGALRVIPGSHQLGRLSAADIFKARANQNEVICSMHAGDALLMRPLLLHASSEASAPTHRRVIHLEYAACPLPDGLTWAEALS